MEDSKDLNPRKKIFISATSFKELVLNCEIFVDKSSFIEDVLTSGDKSIIITRPRRWGKSLNLDMLKNFLEYKPNEAELKENRELFEGEDVLEINTNKIESEDNKELFEDKFVEFSMNEIKPVENKNLFEGESKVESSQLAKKRKFKSLNIYKKKNEKFYKENIGKYAVIFLQFNNTGISKINSENFEDILRKIVKNACKPYEYLYHKYLTKRIKKYFERNNITADISKDLLSELQASIEDYQIPIDYSFENFKQYLTGDKTADINDFLNFIINFLKDNLNLESYIIVDEYDFFLNGATNKIEFDGVKVQLGKFLLETKKNDLIKQTIMMGIIPFTFGSGDSNLNHFKTYSIMKPNFKQSFGFTEDEVRYLCEQFFREDELNKCFDKITSWYNGYNIKNVTLYNPWSIMNCLSTYKFDPDDFIQNYWIESGSLDYLNKMDYFKITPSLIKDIFVKETITASTVCSLTYDE